MAGTIGLTEAVAALRDQFGPQLRAGRDEGHDMMVDALSERFGIDRGEAADLVEALEKARTIRWVEAGPAQETTITAPSGARALPLGVEEAYWQF